MALMYFSDRSLPFRWDTTCWILILICLVLSQQSSATQARPECQLHVVDEPIAYLEFIKKIKSQWIRVIYFQSYIGKYRLQEIDEHGVFYAWARQDHGEAIFSLPSYYITTGLSLYTVFTSTISVNFTESIKGCFRNATTNPSKTDILYQVLRSFTRLNNTCTGINCGTICKRNFITSDGRTAHEKVTYSCCELNAATKAVDTGRCLIAEKENWYVPFMQILVILLTIPMGAAVLVKGFNMYTGSLERNIEVNGVNLRILNQFKLQTIGYFYHRQPTINNRWKQLYICFMYLVLCAVLIAFGYASLVAQVYPTVLIISPEIYGVAIPPSINIAYYHIGITHLWSTIAIILTHLKEIFITDPFPNQVRDNLLPQDRHLTPIKANQLNLEFRNIFLDMIANIRSYNIAASLKNLGILLLYLPFFITNSSGIIHITASLTEVITLRLKYHFLPSQPRYKILQSVLSCILYMIGFSYSMVTIFQAWIALQFMFRVIITVAAFVVAYSIYFSVIVVVVIPYIHYIIECVDSYSRKEELLTQEIIKLQAKVDQELLQLLRAREGSLIVYFFRDRIHNTRDIIIDVPEILNDNNVKNNIRKYLRAIIDRHNYGIHVGISKMVFYYKMLDDNTFNITLPYRDNERLLCDGNGKEDLFTSICQHLQKIKAGNCCPQLIPIFYDVDSFSNIRDIAIPSELYCYLRYYAPRISLNLWQIAFNILKTTGIFFSFILTVLLHSNTWSFTSLSAAIANTPIIYVATTLSLKYFKIPEVDKDTTSDIIFANLIQYRRGYRLFCTRGIESMPISKLIQVAATGTDHRSPYAGQNYPLCNYA